MRLWHYEFIPYLPKSQLVAQWRELNSIYKKQDKHILINYIYDYPKAYLKSYSDKVVAEMKNRGYKIRSYDNYNKYFDNVVCSGNEIFEEHDNTYMRICYYNLLEKYMRGQKDFSLCGFMALSEFYSKE